MTEAPLIGIFVGGRGMRMGGIAKGLLPAPEGGTLIERMIRTVQLGAEEAHVAAELVLVGGAEAYSMLGLAELADDPPGIGPLGGLSALLGRAHTEGREAAVALSCDLPFITPRLVFRLITEHPGALALAPRLESLWSPLTARYSVGALSAVRTAIAAGEHSLQKVFVRLGPGCRELVMDDGEHSLLRDWDRPEDMQR